MSAKVYIYKSFERFWHWTQAFLIFFLAATGFEIHGSFVFFGYQNAVKYHNIAAYAFIILILFAIFWHFSTGEWKQYLPTAQNLKVQINYYLLGIFKNAPHPTKKTVLSKLNPLQKLVYLGLKILVIPVVVLSGLLYMYYRYPQQSGIESLSINSLGPIAIIHTAGAFILIAFIITHLYLITTGNTITSNLKAMITGYEEIEEQNEENNIIEHGSSNNEAEIKNVNIAEDENSDITVEIKELNTIQDENSDIADEIKEINIIKDESSDNPVETNELNTIQDKNSDIASETKDLKITGNKNSDITIKTTIQKKE